MIEEETVQFPGVDKLINYKFFDYFVNGDGYFAQRMRIEFRIK